MQIIHDFTIRTNNFTEREHHMKKEFLSLISAVMLTASAVCVCNPAVCSADTANGTMLSVQRCPDPLRRDRNFPVLSCKRVHRTA